MGACGSKGKQDVEAPVEMEINPDTLREEISALYKEYIEKKDSLKPFILEKMGLEVMLEEKRAALAEVMKKQDALFKEREPLLTQCWERDATDIFKAFQKNPPDKAALIYVIVNRTKWQLKAIADTFEQKYKKRLLEFVVNEMKTATGMFTGQNSYLSMLFTFRIMDQPERDAAFIRDASDGMISLKSKEFTELVCTRSNAELHAAMAHYYKEYKQDLKEMIRKKTLGLENYREFLLKVCECNRDEDNRPFDGETATKIASELFNAGKNAEPFIRLLAPINHIQFESVNSKYKDNKLIADIRSKFSGDFRDALLTRVQSKYDYFAMRMESALGGITGPDGATICRILGSMSRIECVRLHDSYNRLYPAHALELRLKSQIDKESFRTACENLLCPSDTTLLPLGSDRELGEDEEECNRDGERTKISASINYKSKDARERGEKVAASRRPQSFISEDEIKLREDLGDDYERSKAAFKPLTATRNDAHHSDDEADDDENESEEPKNGAETRQPDVELDEYGIQNYTWDPIRGRFMSIERLTDELATIRHIHAIVSDRLNTAAEEAMAVKDIYLNTVKHVVVTENWIRIYTSNIKNLKAFHAARQKKDDAALKTSKKK